MATWESKMSSPLHDASSAWSIKSASPEDAHPSPLLSRSFLDALGRNSSCNNDATPAMDSNNSNNTSSVDKRLFKSQNEVASPYNHQRPFLAGGGGSSGRAGMVQSGLCKSETVDSHCVTVPPKLSTSGVVPNASNSIGTASTKVTKKRARASRKPPTTVLEADSANFRAMVQQLTGIPAVPFIPPPTPSGLEFLNLVRPSARSLLGFGSSSGLPPLGSSPFLHNNSSLSRGSTHPQVDPALPHSSPFLKNGLYPNSRQPSSMGDFLRAPVAELGLEQQPQAFPEKLEYSSCLSMPLLWDGDVRGGADLRGLQVGEQFKLKSAVAEPEDADHEGSSRMAIVDSWLTHADQNTESR